MSQTPQDPADGTPKRFDSVDVLYAAKDVLEDPWPDRSVRRSWAFATGIYTLIATLLDVSEAEAERMVAALGERQEPRRG